jgi:nicotinate phosphoribosyltransferase
MGQAVFHQHPKTMVKYRYKCRADKGIDLGHNANQRLENEIQHLCNLRMQSDELEFLESLRFFKPSYLEFLRMLQLNQGQVSFCYQTNSSRELTLEIKGPWFTTIYFEVPLLAIISEIHTSHLDSYHRKLNRQDGSIRLGQNIEIASKERGFKFADFGTRRRASYQWQLYVLNQLQKHLSSDCFVGTSNVHFAKINNLKPIGTMAHEWIQAFQGLHSSLQRSQQEALLSWTKEYQGDLGIALTDTLGMDTFLRDFNFLLASLFSGCRHDSGDPYSWGDKLITHYERMGIDPSTKHAIFSDGLDFTIATNLKRYFYKRFHCSFGIGTKLMNDIGITSPNIVIKMVECNGHPVAKISDSPGKQMCEDQQYLQYLKHVMNIQGENI